LETIVNPRPEVKPDPRRSLPSVDRLAKALRGITPSIPEWAATEGARQALAELREALSSPEGVTIDPARLEARSREIAAELCRPHPTRVVNATGIVLHTNLGRAPLAPGAAAAVARAAEGYGDLELELSSGERGNRMRAVAEKLRLISGAADALAVNNCAAAVLLALATLGRGREVVVSRGELVEIGGAFRVPAILEAAGVRLVEVGTTNRTHARDYEAAIGPDTALLLKVHRSNFAVSGFVAEVGLRELAEIGARHSLPVVEDLGSGTLLDLSARGFPTSSYAPGRLAEGADVVCFSGDKLLGGPQAGLVLARDPEIAEAMRRNPLARALRLDKLVLAALDWTLATHLEGRAADEIPVLRMLLASPEALEARARALGAQLADRLGAGCVTVVEDRTPPGGGSLPEHTLASWVVELRTDCRPPARAARLRHHDPPILARVRDDALVLDPRTLAESEDEAVVGALADTGPTGAEPR
jgi:L-seryl-tRNA(Ser) seleniumtransferase